jgi:hypothetical protein
VKSEKSATAMNKVLMMAVLLPLNVWAQSVTYNHDESVMNQFTIGEIGAGSFTPDFYYDALHKNYRNGAMMTNKQFYRSQLNLVLYQEVPHAEAIDSALTERMRVEAINMADRTPGVTDLAWQVEKSKIEGKLSILKSNIERITLEGGSVSSYQTWLQRYNAINCGLQAVRDAYMPQGSRKQQYLAIYKDILQKTVEVCDYISYLRKLKEVKKQPNSAPAPRHSHIYTVCRAAHGRWKVAMAAGSGVGE